ncbi:undecaprenyl/decaprenyl-phosphate alpha-N-acetylglucosaminyl 1-phosphate transferase [bacterium]|nr:undecaprenyl/decaprenyl-phosphate alpha-N-acetylglucosaminyl 1-phosphate transferase [bacterium]
MKKNKRALRIIQRYFVAFLLILVFLHPDFRFQSQRIGQRWAFILSLSACIVFLVTPLLRSAAKKASLFTEKDKKAVPLLGGVAVYIGLSLTLSFYSILSQQLFILLSAGTIVLLTGLFDDFIGLGIPWKLPLQVLPVLLVIYSGIHFNFFASMTCGKTMDYALTFFWIIGITNVLGYLDAVNGIATGSSAIMAFFLGILACQTEHPFLGWTSAAILGSCMGFLPYALNSGDKSMSLGNAGSTFLGFMLASVAVMGNWGLGNPVKTFAPPLLIFALLIFELTYNLFSFIVGKKWTGIRGWFDIISADQIHHSLKSLGMTRKQEIMFIFLFEICIGSGALLLRQAHTRETLLLLMQGMGMLAILGIIKYLSHNRIQG